MLFFQRYLFSKNVFFWLYFVCQEKQKYNIVRKNNWLFIINIVRQEVIALYCSFALKIVLYVLLITIDFILGTQKQRRILW